METQLKGAQLDVMALEAQGHTVVLGTAGSGKTTMALMLAERNANLKDSPKVLVLTFNRALVAYMSAIKPFKDGVTVENFHHFARGYLRSQGKEVDNVIIPRTKKENIITEIVSPKHERFLNESTFLRSVNTFIEEIEFLENFGVSDLEQYISMERIGRADTYISRDNRRCFYEVYEEYKIKRAEAGYLYDWDDLAIEVYETLMTDESPRRYKHIIVDEGQDFSPMMLRALVKAVPPDGSFTFFGDIAQQIYGNALSWKASGIETKKIWKFEYNYRNPKEIALFAQDVLKHPMWEKKGDEYVASNLEVPAAGIKPSLVKYHNSDEEIAEIVKLLKNRGGRNIIVVQTRQQVTLFMQALFNNHIRANEIKKDRNSSLDDGVYVTTFYSVKGLEFDAVFIPFLNEEDYPDPELLRKSEDKNKVYQRALKLFYVAVTRAKHILVMSYSSELTSIFPKDSENFIRQGEK